MKFLIPIVLTIAAFVGASASAHADLVTHLSVDAKTTGSDILYTYTLNNDPLSTLLIQDIYINVSPDANLTDITGPAGWAIDYQPGYTQVTWYSDFPGTLVPIGGSATFSFHSTLNPLVNDYETSGIDIDGTTYDTNAGQIASPGIASVPEPTSMIPLGTGLAAIGGYSLRRRGKAEDHPADSD